MPLTKKEFGELWLLLIKKLEDLTDEEIESLLAAEDQLKKFIQHAWSDFPEKLKRVKLYLTRKKELSEFSTEELEVIQGNINRGRESAFREAVNFKLADSFFEVPRIDSYEHVVFELLQEREEAEEVVQ